MKQTSSGWILSWGRIIQCQLELHFTSLLGLLWRKMMPHLPWFGWGMLWCKWKPYSLSARASTQKSSGCSENLCSVFHRPLALDWCELQTSTYLIKANQQPVTRALWGFCYYTKQLRGSFRLIICCSVSQLADFSISFLHKDDTEYAK